MSLTPYDSKALTSQSSSYPKKWEGRVPKRVKTTLDVSSDLPHFLNKTPYIKKGTEVNVYVNSQGAVTALRDNTNPLGLMPCEFEVTEWHPSRMDIIGQNGNDGLAYEAETLEDI